MVSCARSVVWQDAPRSTEKVVVGTRVAPVSDVRWIFDLWEEVLCSLQIYSGCSCVVTCGFGLLCAVDCSVW